MEGQTKPTDKLKFIESKKKIKAENKITQPHYKLVTAANNHNLTVIGCEDNTIKYIETSLLLDFNSTQPQVVNQPANLLASLSFRPTLISVARYGHSSILLVAGISSFPRCPVVEVYDLDSKSTIDRLNLSDLGDSEIIDYAWHPNYSESLVALCSSRGHLLVLAINKQTKSIGVVYKNEQYGALTCCWSMKGKNLAVGTLRGQLLRLEPVVGDNSFTFKEVAGSTITFSSPKVTADHQLVKLRWINQKYLIATHAKPLNPGNPETVYSVLTVKPGKPYLHWSNVNFESQTSSNYVVHMANLSNSVICISSATGEAATIGVTGANEATTNDLNDWSALIIEEEGARIELPLDANNGETHPCGVTMTTWPQDGRPILIFYTSDGLICSYAVIHSDNILKFPEHLNQPQQTFNYVSQKPSGPQASLFSLNPAFGAKPAFYQSPDNISKPPEQLNQPQQAFGNAAQNPAAPQASSFSFGPAFGAKPTFYQSPALDSSKSPFSTSSTATAFSGFNVSGTPATLFGQTTATASTTTPAPAQTNLFAAASKLSLAPANLLAPASTPAAATTSLFGAGLKPTTVTTAASTPAPTNLFATAPTSAAAPAVTSAPTSIFATVPTLAPATTAPSTPKPASTSLFGAATTPSPATTSLFGAGLKLTPATTTASTPTQAPTSLFATVSTPASTPSVTSASTSLFATASAPTPAPTSLFGAVSTPISAPKSLFSPAAAPSPSIPATSTTASTPVAAPTSLFATASTLTSTPSSLFATAPKAKPVTTTAPTPALATTNILAPAPPNLSAPVPAPTNAPGTTVSASALASIRDGIKDVRGKLEFNMAYITLFEELNHLRDHFDQTIDLHKTHHEAIEALKGDIDHLDLEVLETFYLIEYVKSRISCDIKKRSIDPITSKKVNNIKMKLKQVGTKLEELSDHVDVAWEDFVRRRSTKERPSITLDAIYKALATNQKIINILKKKVEIVPEKPAAKKVTDVKIVDEDLSKFEEFLASRSVVPVRQPVQ